MLESLLFNAGSNPDSGVPLSVDLTPLTIFVGPNNSGKSRALIEIESQLKANHFIKGHVINQVFIKKTPRDVAINELKELEIKPYVNERVNQGHIIISRLNVQNGGVSRLQIPLEEIIREFENPNANEKYYLNQYYAMFTMRLDGSSRLSLTSDQSAGDLQSAPSNNLMYLFKNNELRAELRNIIYSAFEKYFVIDPTNIGMLRIRLSHTPPENDKVERGWDEESVNFHSKARLISESSDGVNAFTGMMISLIAGSPKVTLIDEPEAFLHPSLCSKLGKEISRVCAHTNKNVFISTHSANFLMGCVQSKVPMNIVRLTYDGNQGTSRLLTKEQLTPLMRNPLLRSIGVLNALFYNFVIVTEADADRAFYQEINERLLAAGDLRGIEGCLFLNAQNKQTVWDIIKPLRELGIPSVGIVDIDVLKEGGAVWKKPMDGAFIPAIRHDAINNERAALLKAFNETGKNMKTHGGINILEREHKEACADFFKSLSDYGVFIVPCGEIESWLGNLDIQRSKGSWLTNIFERMGEDSSDASYISPADGDVWDFIGGIKNWFSNPTRKGIPL